MVKRIPDLVKNLPDYLVFNSNTRMIGDYYFVGVLYHNWVEANMPFSYEADHYTMKMSINSETPKWFRDNISCWAYRRKKFMMKLYFIDENEMLLFRLRLG